MKHQEFDSSVMRPWYRIQSLRIIPGFFMIFTAFLFTVCISQAQAEWPQVVASKDSTPISYEVYGAGEPTLVFVHGWSCDVRYWRNQISTFSREHKIVLVDLAGHGHSGMTRETYTMKAFGEDVQAVVGATGSQNIILVGHSMGGAVIAEAARLMPQQVKGLIGVDTYNNVEYPLSREEFDMMIAPLKEDFQSGARQFVQEMFSPDTEDQIREWIIADMSAAPPSVALSAMEELMSQYISGHSAQIFDKIRIPVISINGDLWPIDYEANRRHMFSYEAIVIKGADHFLMMNNSNEFNRVLKQAVKAIVEEEVIK
jgi:pimeloyl-ACP methyl ester carboxylesterase